MVKLEEEGKTAADIHIGTCIHAYMLVCMYTGTCIHAYMLVKLGEEGKTASDIHVCMVHAYKHEEASSGAMA
jgi:hypothetical protein